MTKFKMLDISELCNHKLIYEELPEKGEYGLDGICILKEDFKPKDKTLLDGVEFDFYLGKTADNIVCEGQEIEINEKAEKLHFLGFAYWGDASEGMKIEYGDGEEETKEIAFVDWARKAEDSIEMQILKKEGEIRTAEICLSSGRLVHPVYIHHYEGKMNGNKKIRKIVLPDNMFMHIFAVTLEEGADSGREHLNSGNAERREYKTN